MGTPHPELKGVLERLLANVERGLPDQTDSILRVPAQAYNDPVQWQREIEQIFLKVPLLVALSCDIPSPGDYMTMTLCARPLLIVRGDDRKARVFLNICRHRGAKVAVAECGSTRVFSCPYHSWTYDRAGTLTGIPDHESFGEPGVQGLRELPSVERAGAVFVSLAESCLPGASIDIENWLAGILPSLEALKLDELHPYRRTTTLKSPNWKIAADGYLDGYHIGFLHRDTIGRKSINNRNTYDCFGPHVRIGFANRRIREARTTPEVDWCLVDYMSLVHYVFPNVSMSGGHGEALQLSRLFPGERVNESVTVQHQYFRWAVEGERIDAAEARRQTYEEVVRDEDYATTFGISNALAAMAGAPVLFGRNEPGNQNLHRHVARMTGCNLY
jgi:phenylpropionate dioxygenase-like ring-hydroxylating dioxygenase large terminal subunit